MRGRNLANPPLPREARQLDAASVQQVEEYPSVINGNTTARGELLYGARSIASYLGNLSIDAIYHLVREGRLPAFKIGRTVCARTSTLDKWLEAQEQASTKGDDQ
jgi:excisionase family DNA binding protein